MGCLLLACATRPLSSLLWCHSRRGSGSKTTRLCLSSRSDLWDSRRTYVPAITECSVIRTLLDHRAQTGGKREPGASCCDLIKTFGLEVSELYIQPSHGGASSQLVLTSPLQGPGLTSLSSLHLLGLVRNLSVGIARGCAKRCATSGCRRGSADSRHVDASVAVAALLAGAPVHPLTLGGAAEVAEHLRVIRSPRSGSGSGGSKEAEHISCPPTAHTISGYSIRTQRTQSRRTDSDQFYFRLQFFFSRRKSAAEGCQSARVPEWCGFAAAGVGAADVSTAGPF